MLCKPVIADGVVVVNKLVNQHGIILFSMFLLSITGLSGRLTMWASGESGGEILTVYLYVCLLFM